MPPEQCHYSILILSSDLPCFACPGLRKLKFQRQEIGYMLLADRQRTKDGVQLIVHPLLVGFGRTHGLIRLSVHKFLKFL